MPPTCVWHSAQRTLHVLYLLQIHRLEPFVTITASG